MKLTLAIFCIAMTLVSAAQARPVSYTGGVTLMQTNDVDKHTIHLHYSPTVKYSIGYKGEYWQEDNWQFHGAQLNKLLKRWNKPASQANFYLKSALGFVHTGDGANQLAGFTGVAVDWENRRYFSSYENRFYHAGDKNTFFTQTARIGIAPYLGNYGDLHTWFMLQVDHQPEKADAISLTPLIRLFKSEYLTEIGMNENGDALINFVIRY